MDVTNTLAESIILEADRIKGMKLYKYVSPHLLERVLMSDGGASLKFDYPRNYNDPLELFLTVRGEETDRNVIAYYKEILGEIPQFPTSCFSKRPDIIPMWAHYGREHSGFVIEFDEVNLCNSFPIGYLEDVEYVEETGVADWESIAYAAQTLKPRHTYAVQTEAFKNAYFTKNRCWAYEKERRLVIDSQNFKDDGPHLIFTVPTPCVTALISGVRSNEEHIVKLKRASELFHCPHYKMKIGKSSCIPYFVDNSGKSHLFKDSEITQTANVCIKCGEPQNVCNNRLCQWCSIDDNDEAQAHCTNPFTIIDHYGLREAHGYDFIFRGIKPIGSSINKSSEDTL